MGFSVKLYSACVWNPVPGQNYSSSHWKPLCTWVYKRRSRGLQWELPKLHCRLIWLRNELWVFGRSSTKLMGKRPIPGHLFLWHKIEARMEPLLSFKLNVLLFLHVTSQRPCWWPRPRAFLSSGNGLWELNTILHLPPTWPPCHVVVNQK